MTDKELIRKVHAGNKDALNAIIDKYENWEQKLDTREKKLDQREAELKVREKKLEQQEAE